MSTITCPRHMGAADWPLAAEELRPLTASEIDIVAGGALAISFAKTIAIKAGPADFVFGFGFAFTLGSGATASFTVGGIA